MEMSLIPMCVRQADHDDMQGAWSGEKLGLDTTLWICTARNEFHAIPQLC